MRDVGQENVRKSRRKVTKEVEEEINPGRKLNIFSRKTVRETYFCDWNPGNEPRFQCFFARHGSLFDRIRRRREQRCSLLEKAKELRLERNRICGELNLLSSKQRASIERVREKNRFRFGDKRDQDVVVVCSHVGERWRTVESGEI